MDTTFSEAVTDAPDIALSPDHAVYVARKVGKAYYQLVQHIGAELKVADVSGTSPGAGPEFLKLLRALNECARDLMGVNVQDHATDRIRVIILCGAQLLNDVLRSFLDDVAVNADDDLLETMPTLFEIIDKHITSALQNIGVRFANGRAVDNLASLFQAAGQGTLQFAYSTQPHAGSVSVRVPDFRGVYQSSDTSASTLSYANSAVNSTADLQQTTRVEDEPYELLGEAIGNCNFISQQLQELLSLGHMQSTPQLVNNLWNDTHSAVQQVQHKAQILHEQLANFSANDIANLREPFEGLAHAVMHFRKFLTKLSRNSNFVSEQMMAACTAIKTSVITAMKLMDGARSTDTAPASSMLVPGTSSTSSYAPTTPLNAALGPAAARMVGKDTSSLFRKIDDLHRKERRF